MIRAELSTLDFKPAKDGVAFEVIRALTRTARDAATEIKRELPGKFILRRTWVQKGIRSDAATRSDPVARVYSVDPYMQKQEDGEIYSPSGSYVAIPAGVRQSEAQSIPRSMFPRMLKGKRGVFKTEIQGRGGWGIFQKHKGELKLLYLLRPRKTTKSSWEFAATVTKTVEQRLDLNLR